jgi:DNA-directed RNA polymerase subunit RPC12/RpoP
MMAPAPPDEPDLSKLKPVDYRYRCMVCGAEVTMTASPDAEPAAPRHCREEMHLLSD